MLSGAGASEKVKASDQQQVCLALQYARRGVQPQGGMLGKSGRGWTLWPLHKLIAERQTPREACGRRLPGVDMSTLVSALEIC